MQNESSDINAIRKRLKYVIDCKCKGNQTRFAELLNLPRTTLNDSLGRLKKFNSMILINMAKYLPEVSIYWLITGEGMMDSSQADNAQTAIQQHANHACIETTRTPMKDLNEDKEKFSSAHQETQEFIDLIQTQLQRIDVLETHIADQENRLNKLEQLITDYTQTTSTALDDDLEQN